MNISSHANRHRKRDPSVVLGEAPAQPPVKSVRREAGGFNPAHQQQHAAAAAAPPQHSTATSATRSASFNISTLLAPKSSESPASQADSGHYSHGGSPMSVSIPYGATRGVQYRFRKVDTEAPYSGVCSAVIDLSSQQSDPRIARVLSSLAAAPAARPTDSRVRADARNARETSEVVVVVSNDVSERHSFVSSVENEAEPVSSAEEQLRQELIAVKRHSIDLEHHLANMQQQLAMKEDMLQRERSAKQLAELRADNAEKLLKSHVDLDKLMNKELDSVRKQLEKKEDLLQRERRAKQEVELRANRAEKQLDPLDQWMTSEMEKQMNELKKMEKRKKRASEKINDLTRQLEKEKRHHDKSVSELKRKLAVYENSSQVQCLMDDMARRKIHPRIDTIANRYNIIRLLDSDAELAMSMDEAVEMVRAAFGKCGKRAKKMIEDDEYPWCVCDPCGFEVGTKLAATTHFLSKEHIEKVRFHNASVSRLAVIGWVDMLDFFRNN